MMSLKLFNIEFLLHSRPRWQESSKGQLISKGLFDVIICTKKPTKFSKGFLP